MNHREMAHHKMHEAVLGVLDDNNSIWVANVALTAARLALYNGNQFVITLQGAQATVTTGTTQDKNTAKRLACDAAAVVAGAVAAYADSQSNHELFEQTNFSAADLLHQSDELCETNCANILQAGTANIAALTAAGTLVQADLDDLDAKLDTFEGLLPAPRQAKASTKAATNQIPAAILANDRTIERQIDRLMLKYKLTNPAFFQAYQVARVIVDIGGHPGQPDAPTPPPPSP